MLWIIVTNTNLCKIYLLNKTLNTLELLHTIDHAEIRHKAAQDLTTDRPGHYNTKDTTRGAYAPHPDPKQAAIEHFLLEVIHFLQGNNSKKYNHLCIIAQSSIYGQLLQHFDKQLSTKVILAIQKDLIHLSQKELIAYFKEHNYFNLLKRNS